MGMMMMEKCKVCAGIGHVEDIEEKELDDLLATTVEQLAEQEKALAPDLISTIEDAQSKQKLKYIRPSRVKKK